MSDPDPSAADVSSCEGRDLGLPPRRSPTEAPACAGARDGNGREPPRRPPRGHEWSPAKMAAFLRVLAATQSVSRAAHAVGMGRQSAYKLKRRLAGQPFDVGWEQAVADSRLRVAPAPFAGPCRCPLCGTMHGRR